MDFFTADLHLGHANIIKYCSRPFANVKEMDKIIMGNFNKDLSSGDTLHLLGDLSFDERIAADFFDMLSGVNIIFIKGNHDSRKLQRITRERNILLYTLYDTKIDNQPITMCHYAMRVWNKSHFNAWQVHGHSHGTLPPQGKQYDVGVDTNDFSPVSWTKIQWIMNKSPDNYNYIKGS